MEITETTEFEDHPLYDLKGQMASRGVRMESAEGTVCDFGAHFHGFGKGIVKGGNLCFQAKELEGEEYTLLDFKVSVVARRFLQTIIRHFSHKLAEGEAIPYHMIELHPSIEKIEVHDVDEKDPLFPKHILSPEAECIKISVEPLGAIYIGNKKKDQFPNHKRHIVIQSKGQDLASFHKILGILGLQKVLTPNSVADNERMKIATLFRTYFPKEATSFERSNDLFLMTIPSLKEHITRLAPPMKPILSEYLSQMALAEILPGRKRITTPVTDLLGHPSLRLVTALTGDKPLSQLGNILKMGLLSQELRRKIGMGEIGMSNEDDAEEGSDDSVFVQTLSSPEDLEKGYLSNIHLIISQDVLNTGTYQYFYDQYGNRCGRAYENRPTIFELINTLNKRRTSHEIMVKERIPPQHIQQIVVNGNALKVQLIQYLQKCQLIENGTILGQPLETFIVTRKEFDPTLESRRQSSSSYYSSSSTQDW